MKALEGAVGFLEWDSTFFDERIASVMAEALTKAEMNEVLDWCGDNKIDCLYYLVSATDTAASVLAEDNGFHLMDVRMKLENKLVDNASNALSTDTSVSFREAGLSDLGELREIAGVCYRGITRFYADPGFEDARCDDLYALWAEKSCEDFADVVIVAECDEGVAAFISAKMRPEAATGEIGVMGVGADFRGRGIAGMLVEHALEWMAAQDAVMATVVTQGRNVAAQRAYQRTGFITHSTALWYHKWFR